MIKQIVSVLCLIFVSAGVFAAGVSTTNFSGTSFSNTITNGSSNDSGSYAGSAASREFASGVLSTRNDRYAGSSNSSERFRQTSNSTSEFSGTINTNGIVGRTTESSQTETVTNGRSRTTSAEERSGSYDSTSKAYGGWFTGIIGSESGTYESESSDRSRTRYGSEQYADTYNVNSYVVE